MFKKLRNLWCHCEDHVKLVTPWDMEKNIIVFPYKCASYKQHNVSGLLFPLDTEWHNMLFLHKNNI